MSETRGRQASDRGTHIWRPCLLNDSLWEEVSLSQCASHVLHFWPLSNHLSVRLSSWKTGYIDFTENHLCCIGVSWGFVTLYRPINHYENCSSCWSVLTLYFLPLMNNAWVTANRAKSLYCMYAVLCLYEEMYRGLLQFFWTSFHLSISTLLHHPPPYTTPSLCLLIGLTIWQDEPGLSAPSPFPSPSLSTSSLSAAVTHPSSPL